MAVNLARFRGEMTEAAKIANDNLKSIQTSAAFTVNAVNKIGKGLQTGLKLLGVAATISGVAQAFRHVVREAFAYGDAVAQAGAKTGIAAEEFTGLAYAAWQADIGIGDLGTAFKGMQKNVADAGRGSDEAAKKFTNLGISLESFKRLAPEQQFLAIAEQISRLEDPADRTRAALDLFGKAGANLLPMFERGASGIREMIQQAERMNAVMSGEQVEALDQADRAIKNLNESWKIFGRTLGAEVGPALSEILDLLSGANPKNISQDLRGFLRALIADREKAAKEVERLNALAAETGRADYAGMAKRAQQELDDLDRRIAEARTRLNELRLDNEGRGPPRRRTFILESYDKPKTAAEIAAEEAEEKAAEERRLAAKKAAEEAARRVAQAEAEIGRAAQAAFESTLSPAQQVEMVFWQQYAALEAQKVLVPELAQRWANAQAVLAVVAQDALDAIERGNEQAQRTALLNSWNSMVEGARTPLEQLNADIAEVNRKFAELGTGREEDRQAIIAKLVSDYKSRFDQMTVFAEQAGRNIQNAFADFLFDPFEDGLRGMLAGFIDTVRRMVAEVASAQILGAFFNFLAGATTGGVSDFFGSMAKGITGKAAGGPVSAGTAYLVGERGPEVFIPRNAGSIIPNGAGMGGGVSVVYQIDARGADADRVMAMLPPLLRRTEERTVAHVRELIHRGRLT